MLAVLLCGKELPEELKEGDHWLCDEGRCSPIPQELRRDRDILLARLARKDFSHQYTARYYLSNGHTRSLPLFQLPHQLYTDKEVLIATLRQYPEILLQDFVSDKFLDDSDVFLAYIHSERLKEKSDVGAGCDYWTLFNLLSKFSD